ncbi:MAG TPA: hypothetical protein PLQ41_05525 [bacterium]|nr:hypothetical protein [bacterium]
MSNKQLINCLEIKDVRKRKFFELTSYKPIEKAIPFHNSDKKIKIILGGMRAGKSSACVPEASYLLTFPNKNIWVVGINYDKTDRFMEGAGRVRGVLDYIRIFPGLYKTKRKKEHIIELNNGSKIKGKSVKNPDGFVAEPVDLIVCEDASTYPDGFYDSYIRPRITDTGGKIIINSVPPLKNNWLTKLYQVEKDNLDAFHWTMGDNVYIPKEEIEQLLQDLPEFLSKSIVYGQLPQSDSSIFGDITRNIGNYEVIPYEKDHRYQGGIDIGKIRDRTVLTITDLTTGMVVYIDRFPERMFETKTVSERLLYGLEKYKYPITYIDVSGIGSVYNMLVEKHNFLIPFTIPNIKVRNSLIENLAVAFQRGLTIPNNRDLILEIQNLEAVIRSSFHLYRPAHGFHDDMIISLALSVRGWSGVSIDSKPKSPYYILDKPKVLLKELVDNNETDYGFVELTGDVI